MIYKKYAKLILNNEREMNEKDFGIFFDKFFSYLRFKEQLELLPKIRKEVEILVEIEKDLNKTEIILKDIGDIERVKKEIESMSKNFDLSDPSIIENKKIIGGFLVKNKNKQIDASYKTKLTSLYKKITG